MCHNLKDREINNFLFLTVVAFIKAICSHWNVCHFNTCKRNISLLQRKSTLSTSLITNTTKMLKKNTQCKSNLVVLCFVWESQKQGTKLYSQLCLWLEARTTPCAADNCVQATWAGSRTSRSEILRSENLL